MGLILLAIFIPIIALTVIMFLSGSKKAKNTERPDFFAAAASNSGPGETHINYEEYSDSDIDYNYDVVGESFQRDHLVSLIRNNDAFDKGVITTTAILEPEPTNEFDPTAVKVVIDGVQVGYIPKFDSGTVTEMIRRSGQKTFEVPARIGFDTESSQPLIGVKIALTVE